MQVNQILRMQDRIHTEVLLFHLIIIMAETGRLRLESRLVMAGEMQLQKVAKSRKKVSC